jgi:hypothetical protein
MRRLLALLPLALALTACGGGSTPAATTTSSTTTQAPAAKPKLHVVLTAQSHHPKLGHTWTYEVRVTDKATGKPAACLIHVEVTFGGVPVGQVGRHRVENGVWKETIPAKGKDAFPPAALGQHVVWRATATAPGYTRAVATWPISVVK